MTQEHKAVEENSLHVNGKESVIFLLAGKVTDTAQKVEIYFLPWFLAKMRFKHVIKANIK